MGMFDTVIYPCPECGNEIEFQSKAGACQLYRYHYTSVPVTIAEDISGDIATCSGCGHSVRLTFVGQRRVAMTAVSGLEREYD